MWCKIVNCNYPTGKDQNSIPFAEELPMSDGSLEVKDLYSEKHTHYILDKKACLKGIKLMIKTEPKHFSDIMTENDDAITADIFLQLACLGEVIYG